MADVEYFGVPPTALKVSDNRYRYLASASQTVFAATYAIGYVDVYYNGVLLDPATAYTATNGTSITLATPATGGAIVVIVARPQVQTILDWAGQQVLSQPGWKKFPGGLIFQWGSYQNNTAPVPASGYYVAPAQSYPIAFPTGCLAMTASSTLNFCIAQAVPLSASKFTPRFSSAISTGSLNADLQWTAIGF